MANQPSSEVFSFVTGNQLLVRTTEERHQFVTDQRLFRLKRRKKEKKEREEREERKRRKKNQSLRNTQ